MFLRDLFRFLPRSPLRRALGALNRGEFDQAAALLEGMLQGHRTPPRDLCNYACEAYGKAAQQRRDAGDLAGARRCLERALALQPTFVDLHFRLGEVHEQTDQVDRARGAYEHALALNPRFLKARLALARLLTHRGEADLALKPFGPERGELGAKNLERDLPLVLHVSGEIDRGHPPAAELTLERVTPAQSLLEVPGEIGQVSLGS